MSDWLWETWDYLGRGGWVMVPIALVSLAMWALILERIRTFRQLGGHDLDAVIALRVLRGEQLADELQGIRRQVIDRFLQLRAGTSQLDRAVLQHVSMKARRTLRRRLAAIAVLAAVAPLLGLLGTVLGMIETFNVISIFGTGNAKAMAGGISVALVTTQSGLLVAIPGLFLSRTLLRRARRIENSLDEFTLAIDLALRGEREPVALEMRAP